MTAMLASVRNLAEARLVIQAGVDLIDLKAPEQGSLGGLPESTVREIVLRLPDSVTSSATIGDLPMEPDKVAEAASRMAASGVDYVKIGWFPSGDWEGTLARLSNLAEEGARLVAVLFGDELPVLDWIERFREAGFVGVLLDTRDKARGPLAEILPRETIERFLHLGRSHGLFCGLAGSLRIEDIAALLPFEPDLLGFRGALCRSGIRTAELDGEALRRVRALIPRSPRSLPSLRRLADTTQ
ncbi:MAG TPA: (5-formylfuran-3-yl)methyl phosphate synthase [Methylococcus sp.]|nr:(5-formylfuran-3-yl)methyl phosphate synthase [Methylococcus sp.]